MSVIYHPSKANVVADALSLLIMGNVAQLRIISRIWFVMFIYCLNWVFDWLILMKVVLQFTMVQSRLLCRM